MQEDEAAGLWRQPAEQLARHGESATPAAPQCIGTLGEQKSPAALIVSANQRSA